MPSFCFILILRAFSFKTSFTSFYRQLTLKTSRSKAPIVYICFIRIDLLLEL